VSKADAKFGELFQYAAKDHAAYSGRGLSRHSFSHRYTPPQSQPLSAVALVFKNINGKLGPIS